MPADCRMPAEWEKHASTWLVWPVNRQTWSGSLLAEVEATYAAMIHALLPGERVDLLVPDERAAAHVARILKCKRSLRSRLVFHPVRTVDAWIRDYGPIFVKKNPARKKSRVVVTKWIFNAWGGKYADLARDNEVVDRIGSLKGLPRFDLPLVLEGGSIDMNGKGSCVTTEQCLLNANRNPGLTKKDVEAALERAFGVTKVIWLKKGIEGDDTDGHVDDITRFVGPRTLLSAVETERTDKNHEVLMENLEILTKETDRRGERFRIIELPMPGKVLSKKGGRLPASYANFYIGNRVVLVPVYGHRNDKTALKIIASVFPGRQVLGINCRALVHGLGAIHCVTQQQPA